MYDFLDKIGLKTVLEAIKGKLESYALKSLYGDTTINVGRKAGTSIGRFSTAEGAQTTASGDFSHTSGHYTIATNEGEAAFGIANESNDDTLFSVGKGEVIDINGPLDAEPSIHRMNAFEITRREGKLHGEYIATVGMIPTIDGSISDTSTNPVQSKAIHSALTSISQTVAKKADSGHTHVKTDITDLPLISNPNLLINPNFKINQRGATGGSAVAQSQGYIVDRWRIMDGDYNVNSDSITLNGTLVQTLEHSIGSDFTASVFTSSGAATATYDDSTRKFTIVSSGAAVITGAKLEIGSVATPFAAPDPVEELRKCQRYYRVITNTMIQPYMYYTNLLMYSIPIKDMRDDGVAPTVTISGTINDFSGIVIYNYYGGTKVGDIDTIDASFPKGWGVYLNAHTVFNPSGLSGTLRIADGARVIVDAEIY